MYQVSIVRDTGPLPQGGRPAAVQERAVGHAMSSTKGRTALHRHYINERIRVTDCVPGRNSMSFSLPSAVTMASDPVDAPASYICASRQIDVAEISDVSHSFNIFHTRECFQSS